MPDRNALQPAAIAPGTARCRRWQDPATGGASIPAMLPTMPSKKFDADTAQQRIQDRLVDLGRTIGRGKRRDIFPGASLDLRRETAACRPNAVSKPVRPDRARARSTASAATRRRSARARDAARLSNHFGTSISALAPTEVPLPSTSISTRTNACGATIDHHGAKPERPGKGDRPLEYRDITYGQTGLHRRLSLRGCQPTICVRIAPPSPTRQPAIGVRSTSNVGMPQVPLRTVSTRVPGLRPVRTSETSRPAETSRARVASASATRQLSP